MSFNYRTAHRQASLLGLAHSAARKLASVLLEHRALGGACDVHGAGGDLAFTHEESAENSTHGFFGGFRAEPTHSSSARSRSPSSRPRRAPSSGSTATSDAATDRQFKVTGGAAAG